MGTQTTVRERPILFSGPMVRAILEGRKTQTRRVMQLTCAGRVRMPGTNRSWHLDDPNAVQACPYGVPGHRLWVRETWARHSIGEGGIAYRADGPEWDTECGIRWRPSIHMPRALSRITLEIVVVRVERLQDVTAEDVIAEGVEFPADELALGIDYMRGTGLHRVRFKALWDSINAKRGHGWATNPLVWVVEFKLLEVASDGAAE